MHTDLTVYPMAYGPIEDMQHVRAVGTRTAAASSLVGIPARTRQTKRTVDLLDANEMSLAFSRGLTWPLPRSAQVNGVGCVGRSKLGVVMVGTQRGPSRGTGRARPTRIPMSL